MAEKTKYYTLAASLPYLPPIEQAQRLPISQEAFDERLSMLNDKDSALLKQASQFLCWQNQYLGRTDEEIIGLFTEMLNLTERPRISAIVKFILHIRMVTAAIRLRDRGLGPESIETFPGHFRRHMQLFWKDPDFKLAPVFPWLPSIRTKFENGETLALEKQSMQIVWRELTKIVAMGEFDFAFIFAYAAKWDILQSWLEYKAEAARQVLEQLINKMTHDYEKKLSY